MKNIKMCLYGEPGVGKSTFAYGAPNPFFITTDGNYEYLEDYFGADHENHRQVSTWKEAKNLIEHNDFKEYDTIVVDLLEDLYMWAETEFCQENAIKHISDFGYGKGYGMLGNDFFITLQKLIALPKNIIFILHGTATTLKDRRGVEYTKYAPSTLIREKLITQIEGRVRFFLRAYAEITEENNRLVTKRYLSLSPDGNTEYGIARGLIGDVPKAIPLDWETFYNIATKDITPTKKVQHKIVEEAPVVTKADPTTEYIQQKIGVPAEPTTEEAAPKRGRKKAAEPTNDEIKDKLKDMLARVNGTAEPAKEEPASVEEKPAPVKEEPTVTTIKETVPDTVATKPTGELSPEEKLAAIRAKFEAIKAQKK